MSDNQGEKHRVRHGLRRVYNAMVVGKVYESWELQECDQIGSLGMSQQSIMKHLNTLNDEGLVTRKLSDGVVCWWRES